MRVFKNVALGTGRAHITDVQSQNFKYYCIFSSQNHTPDLPILLLQTSNFPSPCKNMWMPHYQSTLCSQWVNKDMCGFEISVASSFHRVIVRESIIYIESILLKHQNVWHFCYFLLLIYFTYILNYNLKQLAGTCIWHAILSALKAAWEGLCYFYVVLFVL